MNFVHSFPHSCISIALLVNKQTEIGIIYNPMLNQKFTARRGAGAFLNGKPTHVSGQTDIAKSLVTTDFSANVRDEKKFEASMDNIEKISKIAHA